MKIVVCIKQVPDTNEVRIDPVTNNLVREGIPCTINPYDENAVEAALELKEKVGAQVVALSMGPPQAQDVLQYVLNMGVDEAVLLSDKALSGSDTLATGYALSALIKTLDPDLILCGSEAIDGCTGQVGPIIAENLGLPQFTYVSAFSIDGKHVKVEREMKEGFQLLSTQLPAVLCVLKGINSPRKPQQCGKSPICVKIIDLGLDELKVGISGSPTRVAKVDVSNKRSVSYVVIDSTLPVKERIKTIINGGIEPKKISLTRGSPAELAKAICEYDAFEKYLAN